MDYMDIIASVCVMMLINILTRMSDPKPIEIRIKTCTCSED